VSLLVTLVPFVLASAPAMAAALRASPSSRGDQEGARQPPVLPL
jgi:hypothetical protein